MLNWTVFIVLRISVYCIDFIVCGKLYVNKICFCLFFFFFIFLTCIIIFVTKKGVDVETTRTALALLKPK